MRLLPILLFLSVPVLAETPDSQTGAGRCRGDACAALAEAVRQFHAQELESAEEQLLGVRKARPEDASAAFYLGRVYLAQGRFEAAVSALERSTRLDPTSSVYQFWLGEALVGRIHEVPFLFKLGVANRMRAAYEEAVELDHDNLEARVAVARYHSEAPAVAGGSPAIAQEQLEEIRLRDPALAHVAQGLIHEQLGRPEPAAEEIETALEIDPESVISWREAGLFYQRRQRWEDAQRAFDQVLAREPEDPVALYEAAHIAIGISRRQLARAERTLEAYLRLEPGPDPVLLSEGEAPKRAVAHRRLGLVYQRQGRPFGAELAAESRTPGRTDVPLVDAALVD